MGAARPQTPRRSPRQAFGGNSEATPQGGKQTKTKTLRNPQNFSYEVSHLRGHASVAQAFEGKANGIDQRHTAANQQMRSLICSMSCWACSLPC